MGMYTGLRFHAKLNTMGREIVAFLDEDHSTRRLLDGGWEVSSWQMVATRWLDLAIVTYAREDRADFIPYGALAYMPRDWEEEARLDDEGVWHVCCSLKNYNGEIEKFLETVLPLLISEPCTVERMYEEDDGPEAITVDPKE